MFAGTVLRCHGLRGDVVARMFLAGPVVALPAGTVLSVGGREMVLARCAVRDARRINLGFDGVDSREAAAPLAGLDIALSRGAALAIGGFRPLDLFTGMKLVSSRLEGVVLEVDPEPANPLVAVDAGHGRRFEVPVSLLLSIGEIDWAGGAVRVELPVGIEDLD
ncbi:hypothetical protein GX411_01125 [Candidatus Fermentibacteria bacterium]|nr:hypothetical protein [Candidatus Fermentibacteria bacterium]